MHYEKFADGSVKCIEDEIPFELPDGWAWARISSICVINPKNDLNDDTEVSFIPMPHICEGYENCHSFDIRRNTHLFCHAHKRQIYGENELHSHNSKRNHHVFRHRHNTLFS